MKLIAHSMPLLGAAEERAAVAALRSGYLSEGPRVEAFERAVARTLCHSGAVAASSGTAALVLALHTLQAGGGDEVIIPSYVCSALLDAVNAVGASPVVVDVDEADLNISPAEVARAASRKTRAVIVPHMFGNPAAATQIAALGAPVIEDLAQCVKAERGGRAVGAAGSCAVLSFYATKLLTTGYGGMLVSSGRRLLARARDLRAFDNRDAYEPRPHVAMSELAAAVGLVQWRRLDAFIRRRRALARRYDSVAGDFAVRPIGRGVYYRYLIRAPQGAEKAIRSFRKLGVEAKRPVYLPLHRYLRLGPGRFPVAEKAFRAVVSVPLYPALTEPQVRRILSALKKVVGR
jgi:dTDP-4-amino-4,6-dideoxygalactose transaminase